jgi:hypothetical protein
MFNSIRQSPKKLRLWLNAVVAVLLLTSVLEAGHVHGVFTATDDNCTLCQHSIVLDKAPTTISIVFPLLLVVFATRHVESLIARFNIHPAHIRAPPAHLHTH